MEKFNFKKVNFIMRVVQNENNKFKFDVLYRTDLVLTNNKEYESIKECINGLANYCETLASLGNQDHLIVNLNEE